MTIKLSRRGDVEPFHAMDVLAEANRLRAEGQADVISMAVGQPSDARAGPVREAAAGMHWPADVSAIRTRSAQPGCARRSRNTIGEHYGIDVPAGAHRRDHRFVGRRSTSRSSRSSTPATALRSHRQAIRPTATSCGARNRGGRDRTGAARTYLTAATAGRCA
jgi:aspartate/methionine/tyrosine aminotransferase